VPDFLVALLGGATAGGVIVFLLKAWIEARVKSSIEHEYSQKLEVFRRELDQKQKVELMSELLAEWIAIPRGEPIPREKRTLLNRLSFQAALWLPPELAIELSKTIQLQPNAKSIFEIILLGRKVLTGDESLTPAHVTFWNANVEKKGDPLFYKP
jgi:hypothetical protein